ncbi:hypothetical protein [Polyangium fumosum]|nr:hypothetical protein [Polyangium fumosum]
MAIDEPFAALRAELRKHKVEEDALLDGIAFAKALMVAADDVLDLLVDETKKAVLARIKAEMGST